MVALDDQTLWAGGSSGEILVVRGMALVRRIDLQRVAASSKFFDREGRLLVTTSGGVLRFVPSQERRGPFVWTTANGLPENFVTTGFMDTEGDLWFGGNSNGISVLNTTRIVRFPLAEVTEVANNACGAVDRRDHLWTIARNGLLEVWQLEKGEWTSRLRKLPLLRSSGPPTSISYDGRRDILWVTRLNGNLESYSAGRSAHSFSRLSARMCFRRGIEVPQYTLLRLQVDSAGRLYASFQGLGVVLFDPYKRIHSLRAFTLADGIPDLDIRAILVDRKNHLWCGTYPSGPVETEMTGGASRPPGRWTASDGLPGNSIRVIFEDSSGRIWAGTRYAGLAVINGNSIRSISVRDGLLSNAVWSVAEDSGGSMWVGTQTGLQSVDPGTFRLTNVPALEQTDVVSCGAAVGQSILAYSPTGATMLRCPLLRRTTPPPPICITRVTVNGRERPYAGDLELSASESNITVNILAVSLGYPQEVRYRYKFEPIDDSWRDVLRHHFLSFAALSPGGYRLLVSALNADGSESPAPATLRFTIAVPVWKRWWFIALAGAACVLAAVMIAWRRTQHVLLLERLRTRIATDLHDDIGANLTRITVFADDVRRELSCHSGVQRGKIDGLAAEISTISGSLSTIWVTWYGP